MSKPWIGVDLDGTLATYEHGSFHPHKLGEPIPKMVERVKAWLDAGIEVKVFTARVSHDGTREGRWIAAQAANKIRDWTEKHIGVRLNVTCSKDYDMLELWDDRAVQVRVNTGEAVGYSTRGF